MSLEIKSAIVIRANATRAMANSEKTLFHLFWTEEGLLFDGGAVLG